MLQVNFREGAKLAEYGTCRIELPDDDAQTMQVVNRVLHYRQFEVLWNTDALFLQNVAIVADKYACTGALSYWARVQLMAIPKAPGRTDTVDAIALFVAYVFDFYDVF